jgi:hypothetical protein
LTEHDQFGRKFVGFYAGVVVDNADPLKIGRVRIRVPGIIEPSSNWALPLGFGGGERRGFYAPPEEGDEVGLWFHAGDVDRPYYVKGHWGAPQGSQQTPGPVGGYAGDGETQEDISAEDCHKVMAFESNRFIVIIDEREGSERLVIRDKTSDDQILIDGVQYGVQIKASSMLHLKADGLVKIEGATVVINGRTVAPLGRPIR